MHVTVWVIHGFHIREEETEESYDATLENQDSESTNLASEA